MLRVFSGECCLCDVGIDTGEEDFNGEQLHTGDFVNILSGFYVGSDAEFWSDRGITLVVSNQYTSYTNGKIELNNDVQIPFVMGIKDCGFKSEEWRIELVKSHKDVVSGEKWPNYGFNFREDI